METLTSRSIRVMWMQKSMTMRKMVSLIHGHCSTAFLLPPHSISWWHLPIGISEYQHSAAVGHMQIESESCSFLILKWTVFSSFLSLFLNPGQIRNSQHWTQIRHQCGLKSSPAGFVPRCMAGHWSHQSFYAIVFSNKLPPRQSSHWDWKKS